MKVLDTVLYRISPVNVVDCFVIHPSMLRPDRGGKARQGEEANKKRDEQKAMLNAARCTVYGSHLQKSKFREYVFTASTVPRPQTDPKSIPRPVVNS